jgi:hypothetical protein
MNQQKKNDFFCGGKRSGPAVPQKPSIPISPGEIAVFADALKWKLQIQRN